VPKALGLVTLKLYLKVSKESKQKEAHFKPILGLSINL
jgi:hypothetical protein